MYSSVSRFWGNSSLSIFPSSFPLASHRLQGNVQDFPREGQSMMTLSKNQSERNPESSWLMLSQTRSSSQIICTFKKKRNLSHKDVHIYVFQIWLSFTPCILYTYTIFSSSPMFTTSNTNSSSCPASNLSEYVRDDFSGILSVKCRLHLCLIHILLFQWKTHWCGMVCHYFFKPSIMYWE